MPLPPTPPTHPPGIFRERLKSSKLWAKIGAEAYENLSVDEVVSKLLTEEGLAPPTCMQDMRWGSPTAGGGGRLLRGGGGGGGGRNSHHKARACAPVAEEAAADGGCCAGGGGGGCGGSGDGGSPVFAAADGQVSVNMRANNGKG